MTTDVKTQQTYKGKSANQILTNAEISEMRSGNVEITISEMPGVIANQDNDGDLILADIDGWIVVLTCGVRACKRLESLVRAAETRQAAVNERI